MKTVLDVPFEERFQVKNLGARWNPALKHWFVPDGMDVIPFLKWVPGMPKLSKKVKKVLRRRTGKNQGEFK